MDRWRDTTQARPHRPGSRLIARRAGPPAAFLSLLLLSSPGCALFGSENSDRVDRTRPLEFVVDALPAHVSTEMPPGVPVRAVMVAARAEIERRGYTIVRTDTADARGEIVARVRSGGGTQRVRLVADQTEAGTRVRVRSGADAASRRLMIAIAARLGMEPAAR